MLPINKTFISYSRKDLSIVHKLYERLVGQGLDPFIDWADIPAGTDWHACLASAIQQSYAFLFVISESSLNSDICNWELDEAFKSNCQIFPLVCAPGINPNDCRKDLAAINWIFLENPNTFEQQFNKLFDTLLSLGNYIDSLHVTPRAKLTWFCPLRSGELISEGFALAKRCYSIGRAPEYSASITPLPVGGDPTTSRQHALLLWDALKNTYQIKDGNSQGKTSTEGVLVSAVSRGITATGGRKLEEDELYPLRNLELFRIGRFGFCCYELISNATTISFDPIDTLNEAG